MWFCDSTSSWVSLNSSFTVCTSKHWRGFKTQGLLSSRPWSFLKQKKHKVTWRRQKKIISSVYVVFLGHILPPGFVFKLLNMCLSGQQQNTVSLQEFCPSIPLEVSWCFCSFLLWNHPHLLLCELHSREFSFSPCTLKASVCWRTLVWPQGEHGFPFPSEGYSPKMWQ